MSDVIEVPQVSNGEASGEEQALAYLPCIAAASSWTVAFDFHTDGVESQEMWALFSDGTPFAAGATMYALGCDGGQSTGPGHDVRCGFKISRFGTGGGSDVAAQIDPGMTVGVHYRLVATANANGALSVSIFQGNTLVAYQSGNAGAPIAVTALGFITGRQDDGFRTYVDNFSFTSIP